MSRALHALALCLLLSPLLGAASVHAQSDDDGRYQALVQRALEESSAGHWQEARALFRQAHALKPSARTLRGIGMVSYELRDYVDAIRHLRQALVDPRRPLDGEQRSHVQGLLDRSLAFVGRYDASALPEGAELRVDGRPVTLEADGRLLLTLGDHDVQVSAPDGSGSARLTVRGGESGPLPITIAPPEPAAAPVADPAGPTDGVHDDGPGAAPAASAAHTAASTDPPTGAVVTTIAGGVVLIAGAALLVAGLGDLSTVEDARAGTAWSEVSDANDRAPLLTGLGIGMLAGGAVLGGVGLVWWNAGSDAEPVEGLSLRLQGGIRGAF